MLIESATSTAPTTLAPSDDRALASTARHEAVVGRDSTFDRAARAIDALDELARRRRSQELVLALERLGAGLDSAIGALDQAVAPSTTARALPTPAPKATWTPISTPVVPITAHVPMQAVAAPAPVAAAPTAPRVPAATVPAVAAEPKRPMRQAPAGLAAHVIDFSEQVVA
ncbi:hypothetical protein [Patulibacter minatonensis]|uniref:hypothetical protein n=1 Tax=Patulibacter minatonensis TaxID=298163 RepID=UPI00047BD8FF|nr:hypothetical protein [Patulibacter minatonensis]